MSPELIARRYAEALLEEAEHQAVIEPVSSDMELVRESLRHSRDLVLFFESQAIPGDKKRDIVEKLFVERVQPLTLRFMQLMVEKGREKLFPQVARAFRELYDERRGIVEVEAQTALDLDDDQADRLQGVLSGITGKQVRIVWETDPGLVGGMVVRVGDTVYDGSIRNQLKVLRGRLAEGPVPSA